MKKFEDVTEYQGQVAAPSADFPHGAPIDSPTPGVGTPYTAETEKVHQALIQKLFAVAGVTPNGVSDTAVNSQLYDVMQLVLNDFNNTSNRNASLVAVAALSTLGLPEDDLQSVLGALRNGAVSTRQTSTTDTTANRLLTPGAFGLGGSAVTVTNFDVLAVCGMFYATAGATGAPTGTGGYFVWHMDGTGPGTDAQIGVSQSTGITYTRRRLGGSSTWQGWVRLLDERSEAGKVQWFATNTTPEGYLRPNGAAVSRSLYADLFAVVGTTFPGGDGSTTFGLPDLRGRFLRAFDDGAGVDSGRVFGSVQSDDFAAHQHNLPEGGADYAVYGTTTDINTTVEDFNSSITSPTRSLVSSVGGTETRPTNVALMPYIKY